MKPFTKIKMIRLPKRWSSESYSIDTFGKDNWNTWNIGMLDILKALPQLIVRLFL